METIFAIAALVLLWSIARSLKRIITIAKTYKIVIDITGFGEDPDPERVPEQQQPQNVVKLRRIK